ncbi:hypothetical protein KL905_001042 [Ogataea polymorpha]|uniref:Uncharacterized protein n=2 Tax=Ogataea polymorpha TaxID=460523 RepID=A0A9P8PKU5_9ASCO|nr:hypothetical protein KL936_001903 [Ogataea polymorpha]KAG7891144.1 hypothetical protein KL908_003897 [Ogataea polymorpha]KAG7901721.1 hypothetical protein KL935_001681 [Ogataea polymorpha]KAG7910239.1 hypothetical protein KL907_001130 [Ogataea polymorpha]KAG7910755.1 hypothetical protein KL906_001135 [Ogataea polymorpha]
MFNWLFGKRLTPQEQMRKNQRQLERTQRELEREKMKLQQQEKKLIQDIKKSARANQMKAIKVQARDLIRTRKQVEKFDKMKTQLQAISLRLQTMRSSNQMTSSMKDAARLLNGMNGQMNIQGLSRITMEFQKSMDIMDQKQEMVDDVMDDLMDDEIDVDDEEEIDEVVGKVLDEMGIDLNTKLSDSVPEGIGHVPVESNTVSKNQAMAVGVDGGLDDDLQARLNELKR